MNSFVKWEKGGNDDNYFTTHEINVPNFFRFELNCQPSIFQLTSAWLSTDGNHAFVWVVIVNRLYFQNLYICLTIRLISMIVHCVEHCRIIKSNRPMISWLKIKPDLSRLIKFDFFRCRQIHKFISQTGRRRTHSPYSFIETVIVTDRVMSTEHTFFVIVFIHFFLPEVK